MYMGKLVDYMHVPGNRRPDFGNDPNGGGDKPKLVILGRRQA